MNFVIVICLAIVIWEWVAKLIIARRRIKRMLDEVETLLYVYEKRQEIKK